VKKIGLAEGRKSWWKRLTGSGVAETGKERRSGKKRSTGGGDGGSAAEAVKRGSRWSRLVERVRRVPRASSVCPKR
jgi:hypothetical protein